MANRYWVGGSGNWSDNTNHWSDSSGGSPGASLPTSSDDVFIDAKSGTGTLTINDNAYCRNINFTNSTLLTLAGSSSFYITGQLTLISGMTFSHTGYWYFSGNGSYDINFFNYTIESIQFYGNTGTFTLQNNLTITNYFYFYAGTFNANGYNVTLKSFNCNNGSDNYNTINLGSGIWTFTGTGGLFSISESATTINRGTSTVVISNTTSTSKNFYLYGKTFYNFTITGDNVFLWYSGTFNKLSLNNAGKTNGTKFESGLTYTVNSFLTNGSSDNLVKIDSYNSASQFNLSKSSGIVECDYLDISNSKATGGAKWYAGANSTDSGNNTGWIFGTYDDDERSAKTTGKDTANSERPSKVTGKATANSERSSKTVGKDTSNSERQAKTTGVDTDFDERDSKVTGTNTQYSQRSAKTHGVATANSERDSKVVGKDSANSERSSKLTGIDTDFSERSGKLVGVDTAFSEKPAKTTGKDTSNSERPATLTGKAAGSSERAAKTHGRQSTLSERQVTLQGQSSALSEISAKTTGKNTANSEISAKLHGKDTSSSEIQAKTTGKNTDNSERSVKTHGKASGVSERNVKITGKDTADSERLSKVTGKNTSSSERGARLTGKGPWYRKTPKPNWYTKF